MKKNTQRLPRVRDYVVTNSSVASEGRGSNALTRDAVRLEIAMRLVISGEKARRAWDIADRFVEEMDKRLPEIELPQTNSQESV